MSDKEKLPTSVEEKGWGDKPQDHYGYESEKERHDKRGLEDWEMVEKMDQQDPSIPYWFVAIFIVLLIVAIGLTFPFWGNRPGYERPWFDWGIPAGAAWVIFMSFIIYYFVDLRQVLKEKREKKLREQEGLQKDEEKVEEKDEKDV